MSVDRRELMMGAALSSVFLLPGGGRAAKVDSTGLPAAARPLPLRSVRLRSSDYATAVEVNRAYLLRLSADRLLHNFRLYAGLTPKGEERIGDEPPSREEQLARADGVVMGRIEREIEATNRLAELAAGLEFVSVEASAPPGSDGEPL